MELAIKVNNGTITPYDDIQTEELQSLEDGIYIIKIEKAGVKKIRTFLQNKALHKYLELLAIKLNDAGFDIRKVLEAMKAGFSIACTKENLKETVWRPMQIALYGIESSTQLETTQVSDVYEHVNRFTAERFGVSQEFPDNYSRSFENE